MLEYIGAGTVPSKGPTVGIEHWKQYVMGRWPGGVDLGAWGVRNMRGSNSLSVHAVGRAWDWRYANPGPGRAVADEAIAFTIANYETLGIQAIHDYVECRIWRCFRPGIGPGWKQQRPSSDMGQSWAQWLHFEVHPDSALHTRSVAEVLGGAGAATVEVATQVAAGSRGASLPTPTLRQGDSGPNVAQLQEILAFWNYYRHKVDGEFGPRTKQALMEWQRALQPLNPGPVDGIYGPRTHAAAAASYASLARLQPAA
jgi:hypothetical protein